MCFSDGTRILCRRSNRIEAESGPRRSRPDRPLAGAGDPLLRPEDGAFPAACANGLGGDPRYPDYSKEMDMPGPSSITLARGPAFQSDPVEPNSQARTSRYPRRSIGNVAF